MVSRTTTSTTRCVSLSGSSITPSSPLYDDDGCDFDDYDYDNGDDDPRRASYPNLVFVETRRD